MDESLCRRHNKIAYSSNCMFVNADSLQEGVRKHFEGKADLIVMDPPYNIADKGKVTKAHGKIYSNREAWGDEFRDQFSSSEYDDLIRAFLRQAFALLVDGGSLFCFIDRKYSGIFAKISESCGFLYKNLVSFVKLNSVPKVRASNFGSAFEVGVWLIKPNKGKTRSGNRTAPTKPLHFNNKKAIKNLRCGCGKHDAITYHNTMSSNVFLGNVGSKRTGHPTEKYYWQLKPILETLSSDSSLVIDLCAGGFNSGLICEELGRTYVGFELDPYYWEKGVGLLCNLLQSTSQGKPWKPAKELKIQPLNQRPAPEEVIQISVPKKKATVTQ